VADGVLDLTREQRNEALLGQKAHLLLERGRGNGQVAKQRAPRFPFGEIADAVIHEDGDGELLRHLGQ
jgi:hypothetical protein